MSSPYVEHVDTTRPGTLTSNVESVVEVVGDRKEVGITHIGDDTTPIWARADGDSAAIAADGAFVVLPGMNRWIPVPESLGSPTHVSLISAGAPSYEVEFP